MSRGSLPSRPSTSSWLAPGTSTITRPASASIAADSGNPLMLSSCDQTMVEGLVEASMRSTLTTEKVVSTMMKSLVPGIELRAYGTPPGCGAISTTTGAAGSDTSTTAHVEGPVERETAARSVPGMNATSDGSSAS